MYYIFTYINIYLLQIEIMMENDPMWKVMDEEKDKRERKQI